MEQKLSNFSMVLWLFFNRDELKMVLQRGPKSPNIYIYNLFLRRALQAHKKRK